MSNNTVNFLGWIMFLVSALGFIFASFGNFWSMFASIFFLIGCVVFLIPFFRKKKNNNQ
ncbi:MAG: hypothetical protein CFH15_00486 [Alphaproteobacteria bacterium MarineAlpha5_Bin5]|nr:MAG: hypothetical protein CFH15_00486 [Alphaproteobacteria bacterium MarineAlpha5_Bin5]PPR51946.1 MAG: hypothetical protein CFH14_00581 [Alphaproteobacteria bacterium MarineAlpha5_Bin4]|tara:strand:- start:27423 stop:27599 length:177 start_codon:yes stop_codon:yes gene_type:complete